MAWVWRPELFTPWQAQAVQRASTAIRERYGERGGAAALIAEVQVAESRDRLAVYVWTGDGDRAGEPDWTVILRKSDLEVVRIE